MSVGLRDRKRQATEARLVAAAKSRFQRDGFDETRLRDVASDADVSEATLYRYFDNKADLALREVRQCIADLVATTTAQPGDLSPLAACNASLDSPAADRLSHDPAILAEFATVAITPALAERLLQYLGDAHYALTADFARRPRVSDPPLGPALTSQAVIGALQAVFLVRIDNPLTTDSMALARQAFAQLASGFE